ncbi:sensor histidine kinase [Timonella sp. A28]|uniref:sensor histidine kinase n=1 Tax=Timonella sp. A28 TaxID=3442640 RepID=UPI003EBE3D30
MNSRLPQRLRKVLAAPIFPPPPLTLWGRVWRYGSAVLFGFISLLAIFDMFKINELSDQLAARFLVIEVVTAFLSFAAMACRRRFPLVAGVTAGLMASVSVLGAGATTITLISVATRRRWREIIPMFMTWVGCAIIVGRVVDLPHLQSNATPTSIATITLFTLCLAIGFYIGSRRESAASLHAQVESLEEAKHAREQEARVKERARIAREMHDVLAHRISLVSLHSGALAYRTDLSAEEVREAAAIIRDNSHQALSELREILGVLRDPSSVVNEAPDAPQPTLADLDSLIRDARLAGTRVNVHVERNTVEQLPHLVQATSRNAYRVLQECLTNVRKHAPHALTDILIERTSPETFIIEVSNPVRPLAFKEETVPGSGLGLVGMAERVRSSGGTLSSGIVNNRFVVHASLPWVSKETDS